MILKRYHYLIVKWLKWFHYLPLANLFLQARRKMWLKIVYRKKLGLRLTLKKICKQTMKNEKLNWKKLPMKNVKLDWKKLQAMKNVKLNWKKLHAMENAKLNWKKLQAMKNAKLNWKKLQVMKKLKLNWKKLLMKNAKLDWKKLLIKVKCLQIQHAILKWLRWFHYLPLTKVFFQAGSKIWPKIANRKKLGFRL